MARTKSTPKKSRIPKLIEKKIKQEQNSKKPAIAKLAFQRFAKDIAREINPDLKVTLKALEMIHEIAESYLIDLFVKANVIALTHKSSTVTEECLKAVLTVQQPAPAP
jgi:histone H3/H4